MEKKKRKASKAQRKRIANMLESGLIDRDEAQEIIEKTRVGRDRYDVQLPMLFNEWP